jgi:hypothetical protein
MIILLIVLNAAAFPAEQLDADRLIAPLRTVAGG